MIQKITNFDKVFNQETEFGEMLARQICNPSTVLSIYHRQKYHASKNLTTLIGFTKFCICSFVIIFSIIKLISYIPDDIKMENNKRLYFNIQKRNDCYSEYIENRCNSTTSPELLEQCKILYDCYTSIAKPTKKVNIISYEWDLINNFFFFLTKKSAAFLGFAFGCFLYYNFAH